MRYKYEIEICDIGRNGMDHNMRYGGGQWARGKGEVIDHWDSGVCSPRSGTRACACACACAGGGQKLRPMAGEGEMAACGCDDQPRCGCDS